MTIRNIGNYLKKKYDCITVYAYPESIDGTCEVMFYYTLLTKDYKVLTTEVNRRDVNKRLYGKEYIDWDNDKERIEAEKFEAKKKYDCITVYAYPESIDGTCEVMFYYTLLTKDSKLFVLPIAEFRHRCVVLFSLDKTKTT